MNLLIALAVIAFVVLVVRMLPSNNCNQDCNQGRACACKNKQSQSDTPRV